MSQTIHAQIPTNNKISLVKLIYIPVKGCYYIQLCSFSFIVHTQRSQ